MHELVKTTYRNHFTIKR